MQIKLLLILVVCSFAIGGCPSVPSKKPVSLPPSPDPSLTHVQLKDLAGGWEYEGGSVVYPLLLDQEGKGTYEWQNGRFQTTSLSNGIWKGTWFQEENDREGGFELKLHQDLQKATGRWWYTRIGDDQNPAEPGGNFSLQRLNVESMGQQDLQSKQ